MVALHRAHGLVDPAESLQLAAVYFNSLDLHVEVLDRVPWDLFVVSEQIV